MTRKKHDWLVVSTPLKNISQWKDSPIYLQNHQESIPKVYIDEFNCNAPPFHSWLWGVRFYFERFQMILP